MSRCSNSELYSSQILRTSRNMVNAIHTPPHSLQSQPDFSKTIESSNTTAQSHFNGTSEYISKFSNVFYFIE